MKWVQLHQQERLCVTDIFAFGWKYSRALSCMELKWMCVSDGKWHFQRILVTEMLSMKEKTHSTTASAWSYQELLLPNTPMQNPRPSSLCLTHIFRILTQNTRYWAQHDNEMLFKISPLKFSSGQIPCILIHPQAHCVCSSCENLWCWSFSSARKHSEPRRTLLPPAESCVLTLFSSQTTSLSGYTSVLIRA